MSKPTTKAHTLNVRISLPHSLTPRKVRQLIKEALATTPEQLLREVVIDSCR